MYCDFYSILRAYYSCRKGKRNSTYQLSFESLYERNLISLEKQLQEDRYKIGKSICFVITYPTVREIFAANFVDRVVHHLLINHIEEQIDKTFIYDSFACRKEHGVIAGEKRLRFFLNKVATNKTSNAYYLKLDIKSFFYSIDKELLYKILTKKINKLKYSKEKKIDLLKLSKQIIFHNPCKKYTLKGDLDLLQNLPKDKSLFTRPPNKGLPIGNLTSQFFANIYLNELDQYIKRELKVKYYLRYADDLLFLSKDLKELKNIELAVTKFLKDKLLLDIKKEKTEYGSVYQGIDFIGYIVRPSYVLTRNRTVSNIKKKLYYFNKGLLIDRSMCKEEAVAIHNPPTQKELHDICASINSAFGHLKWSNSYNLRQDLYFNHFGKLSEYLEVQGQLDSFRPRKPSS
ncbi:MAG: retron-type reverse transcriptase [candidate division WS6 bacterium 34_10]|uniref:Retron-type reverse transcriptase n=1 Tax=candidate division WS6 bacterium 34_10 TaxID=1641389 RepID=A0A101HJ79_9BACT|nr:MAG: retron-type reverse transcriptase [candidate division WS6 bacterium 34_10]